MKHARIPRHLWSLGFAGALALLVALGPVSGTRAGAQAAPPAPPVPNATLTPLPQTAPAAPNDVTVPSPAPSASPSPAPSISPEATPTGQPGRRGRHRRDAAPAPSGSSSPAPVPSATPTSPAFATLDGTWEVQLQYIDRTEYSYFKLTQTTGGVLTGTWKLGGKNGATYPLSGNYDGRLIQLSAAEPTGPASFSGYVEGASDMIGLVTFGGTSPSASPTPGAQAPVAPITANDGVAFTAEHRGAPNHNVLKR